MTPSRGIPDDAIEVTATGGTSLRFEDRQFVYNWKTPEKAGCYELFVTLADGDVGSARFKLKQLDSRTWPPEHTRGFAGISEPPSGLEPLTPSLREKCSTS